MSKVNLYVFEIKDKPGYYSTQYADDFDASIKDVRPSKVLKKAVVVTGYRDAVDARLSFERLRKVRVDSNGRAISIVR